MSTRTNQPFTAGQFNTFIKELARLFLATAQVPEGTNSDFIARIIFDAPRLKGLFVTYDKWNHTFQVSGLWPSGVTANGQRVFTPRDVKRYDEKSPTNEINISAHKHPIKAHAEILRRFMPGYSEMWERCILAIARSEEHLIAKNKQAAALASLVGVDVATGSDRSVVTLHATGTKLPGNVYGHAEATGDYIKLSLHLTEEQAHAVLTRLLA